MYDALLTDLMYYMYCILVCLLLYLRTFEVNVEEGDKGFHGIGGMFHLTNSFQLPRALKPV